MNLQEQISENFKAKITYLIDSACDELQANIGEFNLDAKIHLKIADYEIDFSVEYPSQLSSCPKETNCLILGISDEIHSLKRRK
ncbi:hypothetical protein [Candidatus Endomicrobiellum devescovinae]|jgi:hypothetical protein|uniref:hypothetical protein n=1 Tax=Candidatus Endomicrobiellum devescovinae TaxID=3242322 RepID=UPI002824F2EF|nr:hypothetical protein [Endomicrobium sp.]